MTIKQELLSLQEQDPERILRVETVWGWAKAHPNSALHSAIEWNKEKAAKAYQLEQIRNLIRINITIESSEPQVVSLTIDRVVPGGGYRQVSDVLSNAALTQIMLNDAMRELERVEAKYRRVAELASVWQALDRVRARQGRRNTRTERRREA